MSQDEDPIDATRRFEPIDPYNIPPQAPQHFEEQPYGAPEPSRQPGLKQRLTRLGPLKLALIGTAGVIALGGAAWGTTAALSSGSSSNTAAAAPPADQSSASAPAPGGTGKHVKAPKVARIKITQVGAGSFTGTEAKGGKTVTVDYTDKTRFGTEAHPLDVDALRVGMTVGVAGTLQGDTITATEIVPAKAAKAADGAA